MATRSAADSLISYFFNPLIPQSAIQNPSSTLAKVSAIFAAIKLQHSQFLRRIARSKVRNIRAGSPGFLCSYQG